MPAVQVIACIFIGFIFGYVVCAESSRMLIERGNLYRNIEKAAKAGELYLDAELQLIKIKLLGDHHHACES